MDTPICSGNTNSPTATSAAVSCQFVQSGDGNTWSTDALRRDLLSIAGTVLGLAVDITTDPGAGASWTFDVLKNGSTTGLQVVISTGGALYVKDSTHTFSVVATDAITLQATASATAPAATGNIMWTLIIRGTTEGESCVMGSSSGTIASVTRYMSLQNDGPVDAALANRVAPWPSAGVIDRLYVDNDGTIVSGSYVYTLYVNGSPTALTCTLTSGSTASDLTHSVSLNAGDVVAWEIVGSSPSTSRRPRIGARFVPTTNGESVLLLCAGNSNAQNSTRYTFPGGGVGTWSAIETNRQSLVSACTVQKLYANTNAAVGGAAQTATFTARKGAADFGSSITCSIASGATAGNDTTHSGAVVDGDLLSIKTVNSLLTGTVQASVGIVFFITPSSTVTYPQLESRRSRGMLRGMA